MKKEVLVSLAGYTFKIVKFMILLRSQKAALIIKNLEVLIQIFVE